MLAGTQNSARDQLEDETVSVEDDGMAGVVASRASRNVIERRGKIVHHLALAFITPLCAHYHDRLHRKLLLLEFAFPFQETKRVKTMPSAHADGSATRLRATPKPRIL